ncbi:MAG: LysM peptidoglycan-binding domain-containing protein [Actinomycetes bacterium]
MAERPGPEVLPRVVPVVREAGRATSPGPLRLTRRGRVVLVLAALLVLSLGLSAGRATLAAGHEPRARVVVVQPGETLWGLAQRLAPGHDPRPVIHRICELNGAGCGRLEAGQRLRVPGG